MAATKKDRFIIIEMFEGFPYMYHERGSPQKTIRGLHDFVPSAKAENVRPAAAADRRNPPLSPANLVH